MHYANIFLELFYFAEVVVCHSQITFSIDGRIWYMEIVFVEI